MRMPTSLDFDVIIIGSGIAGLSTALAVAPLKVALVTFSDLGESSSSIYAKGGIAACVSQSDTPKMHAEDTIAVGGGLTDRDVVTFITQNGVESIGWLESQGVEFDRGAGGGFTIGQEAAHQCPRILHINGDQTGYYLIGKLAQATQRAEHVTVIDHGVVQHIVRDQHGQITGVAGFCHGQEFALRAPHVVMATGGVGGLFQYTTNPISSIGSGQVLAARVGARLIDMEFVQFHPTALHVQTDPLPLMTEALRGAGAKLVGSDEVPFMEQFHPQKELAPRDVVAGILWQRQQEGQQTYLDCRHFSEECWRVSFPFALRTCRENKIDPENALIPIMPAAHYHMGGIETDTYGQTNIPGLWAIGECASTGFHGANRLASNSLLEAVVMARSCAAKIKSQIIPVPVCDHQPYTLSPASSPDGADASFWVWLRQTMWTGMGIKRDKIGLEEMLRALDRVSCQLTCHSVQQTNALILARIMVTSALTRCESRGAHQRIDFTEQKTGFLRRIVTHISETSLTIHHEWKGIESELYNISIV